MIVNADIPLRVSDRRPAGSPGAGLSAGVPIRSAIGSSPDLQQIGAGDFMPIATHSQGTRIGLLP
jgi:hypothetical protein